MSDRDVQIKLKFILDHSRVHFKYIFNDILYSVILNNKHAFKSIY